MDINPDPEENRLRQGDAHSVNFSVIVPVKDDAGNLAECLRALYASDHPPDEVIVVDDGSSDHSAEIARRLGARVVELEKSVGAGGARNAGASIARNEHLCFVDADVAVQPSALGILASNFIAERDVDAVFGSYDRRPGKKNIASQYRNLLHHSVHQEANREATTFWSGLGAIKKEAFQSVGGFDADFPGRIEDIDLGMRVHRRGGRLVLDKAAMATHLKEWTLWSMVICDVRFRAIPWVKLMLADGFIPNDLNVKGSQRLCAVLACAILALFITGAWFSPMILFLPIGVGLGLWGADSWTRFRPIPSWAKVTAMLGAIGLIGGLATLPLFQERGGQIGLAVSIVFGVTIVLLNRPFYRVIRDRNPALLLAAFPLHVFYYVYSSASVVAGSILYFLRASSEVSSR